MTRFSRPSLARGALCAVVALCAPLGVAAGQDAAPMTADAFEAYVAGRTVTYAHDGQAYGIEQYFSDRRVIWKHIGGDCVEGTWFEANGEICFEYDGGGAMQCWQFYEDGGGLGARASGDPDGLWLYEVQRISEPLQCPVPYLGT